MGTIPKNAKKVFSGILFDVYQREQQQFDGSLKTFELVHRLGTVQIIPSQGETIFVAYQQQPNSGGRYYSMFGGMVPRDIDYLQQAKNELKEEAGMESSDRTELGRYDLSGKVLQTVVLYRAIGCEIVTGQSLDPGGEMIDVKAVSFGEFIDLVVAGKMRDRYLRAEIMTKLYQGKDSEVYEMILGTNDSI